MIKTPEAAREQWRCPLAHTMGNKGNMFCEGSDCAVWRWVPNDASDPLFISAIQREMACLAQDEGKGRAAEVFHKQAVKNVMANPEGYGIPAGPVRGYCGLGGKP